LNALDKWAERIYAETDFGRSVATSVSGIVGLVTYLTLADWVVAAYSSVIVFPVVKLMAAAWQTRVKKVAERQEQEAEAERVYDRLSDDEKAVVEVFVASGGSVMTFGQINNTEISRSAVESLIQRELLWTSMTADAMRETFVLSTALFDVGLRRASQRLTVSAS
jgi:ABC-type multidrug transport system fused ATPase/permease subunit